MTHSRSKHVKALIFAVVAIALPFYASEFLGEASWSESPYLRWLNRDFWYREFAPGGPRQTRIDEIKIVSLVRNVEPGSALGEFRCTHRAFMAKLLLKIAEADPRLIVVDKWYGRIPSGACGPSNSGTAALSEAIRNISAKVPFVIAIGSYNRDEIQRLCPELRRDDLQSDEMVLGDFEPFDQSAAPGRIRFGLARINADVRKVPLGWLTFPDCNIKQEHAKRLPTIATAAATLLDPNIMKSKDLATLETKNIHPYTKLASAGTFESVSAIRLVCDHPGAGVDWTQCGPSEGDKNSLEDLRHKVVLVGETTSDIHKTDEGDMTGPEMQANYIAALLDESILKPAPLWVDYAVTVGWLGFLFWIFYGWRPQAPGLAAIAAALLTFCLGVLFSAVITRQFGIFADVVPPTILEIIGLYLGRRVELALETRKEG